LVNFKQFENHNVIELFKAGISLIKFRDTFVSENKFMRIIDNKNFFFENNQQILFTKEIKTKFISKLIKTKNLTNNLITLDIETFIHNNDLIPYLICYYDGKDSYSFGL
jgi:aminopeptidase-like protein